MVLLSSAGVEHSCDDSSRHRIAERVESCRSMRERSDSSSLHTFEMHKHIYIQIFYPFLYLIRCYLLVSSLSRERLICNSGVHIFSSGVVLALATDMVDQFGLAGSGAGGAM